MSVFKNVQKSWFGIFPSFLASVDASSATEDYSYAEDLELQEILGDRPSQADDDEDDVLVQVSA